MKRIAFIVIGLAFVCFTLPLIPTVVKDKIVGESIFVIRNRRDWHLRYHNGHQNTSISEKG